jgi:hypothetical protein
MTQPEPATTLKLSDLTNSMENFAMTSLLKGRGSARPHCLAEVSVGVNRIGMNPLMVCERLYKQRGDLVAMRAVVMTAIAERNKS